MRPVIPPLQIQAPDPGLEEIRCPNCRRLLFRWAGANAKVETLCPKCRRLVVFVSRLKIPVAIPVAGRR